ncbi:hypothetical protein [Proteus mirabilis]|uniref:hypothetical protein n=1 Tax=Proteus mirabilis TaxID=584 RepID=UPI000D691CB3|nr:hypothetical protein [Proteus mirabilis]MCU9582583.1 hypothetical protein [Proteus mirabilis]
MKTIDYQYPLSQSVNNQRKFLENNRLAIAGLFNGEISWQHKVSITQLNSVKNWIKAFQKNKKSPAWGVGKLTRYQSKYSDDYLV